LIPSFSTQQRPIFRAGAAGASGAVFRDTPCTLRVQACLHAAFAKRKMKLTLNHTLLLCGR